MDHFKNNNDNAKPEKFDRKTFSVNKVKENTCIIDKTRQWDILLFKEAMKIKEKCATLNSGLKASKELKLF